MLEFLLWGSTFATGVGVGHYGPRYIQNTLQTRRENRWEQEKKTSVAWDEMIETGIDRSFARDRLLDAIFYRSPDASNVDVDEAVRLLHLDSPDIEAMHKCAKRLRGELGPSPEAQVAVEEPAKSVGTILDVDRIRAIKYEDELFEAIEEASIRYEEVRRMSLEDLQAFRVLLHKAYNYADDRCAMDEMDDIGEIQDAVEKLIMARGNLAKSATTPVTEVWVSIHTAPPADRIMGYEPVRFEGYARAAYIKSDARVRFSLPRGTYESLAFWTDEKGGRLLGTKQLPRTVYVGTQGSVISVAPYWEPVPA
jgi:hypothetical protein